MDQLAIILIKALEIYSFVIFVRILGSWLPQMQRTILFQYIYDVTEPILSPLRRLLPPLGGLDFSPMALLFLILFLQDLLTMTFLA